MRGQPMNNNLKKIHRSFIKWFWRQHRQGWVCSSKELILTEYIAKKLNEAYNLGYAQGGSDRAGTAR